MINGYAFFIIWLSFMIIVVCAIIPFAIWAVLSGHFSRFDYARHLPLKSRIIEEHPINEPSVNKKSTSSHIEGKGKNVSA